MYLSSDSATLNTHNLILGDSEPALATPALRAALTHVTVPVLCPSCSTDILTQPFTVI